MRRKTTKEFIQDAIKVHGNRYDYSKVNYVNSHVNVEIICDKHGSFLQTPSNHLKGGGCKICNKIEKRRKPLDVLFSEIYEIHGDKYDYSKMRYKNNKEKVIIICPEHGEFEQNIDHHLRGQGCPKCVDNYKDDTESFIDKAKQVHGDKYDYSEVEYVNSQTKVKIIDSVYGPFLITPNSHLNGRGSREERNLKIYQAKKENGSFGISSCEKIVYVELITKFGKEDVFREYRSDLYPYRCDSYIKSLDLYIELNIYFTHGGHFYDAKNKDDMMMLKLWREKSIDSDHYKSAIDTWTIKDLQKKQTAIDNNLNYLAFFDPDLMDFYEWFDSIDNNLILNNIK